MRTIIAGSRSCEDPVYLREALEICGWVPTVVLSGCARGADSLGEQWARDNGVPLEQYPARWRMHGRRAGLIRNARMADRAEALIALWDGESRGTAHMIETAQRRGLKIHVHGCKEKMDGR